MSEFIIGLTGGIGSGKTTVSDIFSELGIDIVDADIIARKVVEPGSKGLLAIKAHFGDEFVNEQQQLDRTKLRTRIFSHPEDKLWLNNLLHPLIRQEIINQLDQAKSKYCILVAPLLLENSLHKLVNRVLIVDIDEQSQINRTFKRDASSRDEIKRIIASQMSREERLTFADDIINNNNASIEEVRQQVQALNKHYINLLAE